MLKQRNKTMKFDVEPELRPAEFIDVLRRTALSNSITPVARHD